MIKRILAICLVLACCFSLTGCLCRHEWAAASCAEPSKCTKCDKTQGEPLAHIWIDASCTDAKTCQLCSVTEGQPLDHDWLEADCTNPAACSRCAVTEGEALGHDWQYATTEAPKTCLRCALTEGEPIVTDPRFKTAPAADLIGKWKFDTAVPGELAGIPDYNQPIRVSFIIDFAPDGSYSPNVEIVNSDALWDATIKASIELSYQIAEAEGVSRESFDAGIMENYGMSTYDYVKHTTGELNFNSIFDFVTTNMNLGGVYYVEDGSLYTGLTWGSPLTPSEFSVDADTLWAALFDSELGAGTVFQRMSEE